MSLDEIVRLIFVLARSSCSVVATSENHFGPPKSKKIHIFKNKNPNELKNIPVVIAHLYLQTDKVWAISIFRILHGSGRYL